MDDSYAVLFEPVRIGPLTTRNRFVQVPHCNGMGYRDPSSQAAMRRVKAEGGWSVVCTEEVEIHPSSDLTPYIELRLWDDDDLPALHRICEAIHAGGALAGIELCHGGLHVANLASREVPLGPGHLPVTSSSYPPVQARAMTHSDIADLRRWHRTAVRRALQVGYDLIYVYSGHGISVLQQFLSPRYNHRHDEYGGSVGNRVRLLREILEDTLEEADGKAAVACRLTADEGLGPAGLDRRQVEEVLGEIGELPDLWDFVAGGLEEDCTSSRFSAEGDQEPAVAGLKRLTSKPVVGVGRFTSPEVMVRQIRAGILDLIGAARPSIADPFLPEKIRQGRPQTIRECIGCNVCIAGDNTMSPIRCTQNPTMGEEFRRGWHPELIRPKTSDAQVLVVGAGPAGLEAARALGARGYQVLLAETRRQLGGRVVRESALPGLATWARVADHRRQAIATMATVDVLPGRALSAGDLLDSGYPHLLLATGSHWRRDGVGRRHTRPIPISGSMPVFTPDDLMDGRRPTGDRVVVYDDDHYYLGGVLAELLAAEGHRVSIVTPGLQVSSWTAATGENAAIQRRLIESGVTRRLTEAVVAIGQDHVIGECSYTGRQQLLPCDAVVLVTARLPDDDLLRDLQSAGTDRRFTSIRVVGDAWSPGTIAAAVWAGRQAAEEFDSQGPDTDVVPFRREVTALASMDGRDQPERSR